MANANLHAAKAAKNDEFYTQIGDIEKELWHYRHHFRDKTILCNCDDPEWSNFYRYFEMNFEFMGLRRLIATHYTEIVAPGTASYMIDMHRNEAGAVVTERKPLTQNGDFRSPECLALLDEADIVVTNPPFSLFREYVNVLMEHGKKFVILGNQNAITYKEIWPHIDAGRMWLGTINNKVMPFGVPDDYYAPNKTELDSEGRRIVRVPALNWYTNLDIKRRHEEIPLWKSYDPAVYPTYDNYDAIEVPKVKDIPVDYDGVMGVPITFLGKHNPDQFEIVGCSYNYGRPKFWDGNTNMSGYIKGNPVYKRILIRRVK